MNNILKALLLTLAPATIGLTSYYRSIYDYDLNTLTKIIALQLYYVEFRWLAVSLLFNLWLIWKLEKAKNARGEAELES